MTKFFRSGRVPLRFRRMVLMALVSLTSLSWGQLQISTNQQHVPSDEELSHDACMTDSQCLNGGTCAPRYEIQAQNLTARYCRCIAGFSGSHCEDHCPLKCQNQGYCQNGDTRDPSQYYNPSSDNFVCKCKGYFTGKLCNIPYQNCIGYRCYNGGQCGSATSSSTSSSTTSCTCPEGFHGDTCEMLGTAPEVESSPATAPSGRLTALTVVLVLSIVMLGFVIWLNRKQRQQQLYKTVSTIGAADGESVAKDDEAERDEDVDDHDDDPLHVPEERVVDEDVQSAVDDSKDQQHRWRNIV